MKTVEEQCWIEAQANRTDEWFAECSQLLSGMVTERRAEMFRQVAAQRTRYMTICLENTFYAQNASALVRTCEAFGIQDMHTVEQLCRFDPSLDIVRGTDKWITRHSYRNTGEVIKALRGAGYRIVATSPHSDDTLPETFDVQGGRFALVFGTELEGVSDEVRREADAFVRIPMQGMVESLNLSASAAILLYTLSHRVRAEVNGWQMTEREQQRTLWRWYMESVNDSVNILKKHFKE